MIIGSGALYGKMLLVRVIENNKFEAYISPGQAKLRLPLPRRLARDQNGALQGQSPLHGLEIEKDNLPFYFQ